MSRIGRRRMERQKKVKRWAGNTIIACLLGIAVLSGMKMYEKVHAYKEGDAVYREAQEVAKTEEFNGNDVDFDALSLINPDVEGWIYYEGTQINYPIVKGEDNYKYLYTTFDGTLNDMGTLFIDFATEKPFEQFNTIVYGHHMKNGSMFASLAKLKDKSYAEKHPKMTLVTRDGTYDLTVWAFLNPDAEHSLYSTNYTEEESKKKYIEAIEEDALYTIGEARASDRLVVLSTCAYEFEGARYVAIGIIR